MSADLSPTALGVMSHDVLANDLQRIAIHEMRRLADQMAAEPLLPEHAHTATWPIDFQGGRYDVVVTTIARRV